MNPTLLPGDSAALPGGSSGNMNDSMSVNGSNPGCCEGVASGLNFTAAQIELQRQIGQCDGFPAIQTVLRAQLMRSLHT